MPLYSPAWAIRYGFGKKTRKKRTWKIIYRSKGRGRALRPKWVKR